MRRPAAASVLLLDEATSALGTAHRLSTIVAADGTVRALPDEERSAPESATLAV